MTATIDIASISQSQAGWVLRSAGYEGGLEPGGFSAKLIEAMFVADPANLERLAYGFPGLVNAMRVYKQVHGGVKILQNIAAGRPAMDP